MTSRKTSDTHAPADSAPSRSRMRVAKRSTLGLPVIVATLLVAGIVPGAVAEPGDRPGHGRGPDRLEHMIEVLELADDQIPLVEEILEDAATRARELRGQGRGSASRAERRAAMESLREETRSRLAAVLTPAQLDALDADREARGERRRARREGRREASLEAMIDALELAESQIAPVRQIMDEGMARRRALHTAMREQGTSREAVHEAMIALREETDARLSEVLTPAQVEAFEIFRAGRASGRRGHARDRQDGRR